MSDLKEMYPGMPFSPDGYLTKAINAVDTDIHVNDESLFPPAPNIATIGNDENGEVIIYTATAKGVLSGCTRGVVGLAKDWAINTVIARNYTCEDQKRFISNILYLQEHKVEKVENKDLVENEEINKLKSITTNAENKIANDITGNANTATKLKTSVNIFGLSFDGSKDIVEDDNHKLVTKAEKIIIKESSNPNLLINGDFQIWQRGSIFENHTGYTADRWWTTQTAKVEMVKNTSPVPVSYNIKVTCNGWSIIAQPIEFISNYIGKTLTVSFYARSINGLSSLACAIETTTLAINLTSEWKLYNLKIVVPNTDFNNSAVQSKGIRFHSSPNDNGKIYEISSVKLELGEVATPFVPRPYAEELALCKRYYEKGFYVSQYTGSSVPANLPLFIPVRYTVEKRIVPTFTPISVKGTANWITGVLDVCSGTGDDVFMAPGGGTNNSQFIGFVSHNPVYHTYNFYWAADAEIY